MPTIALVDDDRNILTSVSIALEAEGYRINTYTDGVSALDGFRTKPPDLAVLDIKMPRMACYGFSAAECRRRNRESKRSNDRVGVPLCYWLSHCDSVGCRESTFQSRLKSRLEALPFSVLLFLVWLKASSLGSERHSFSPVADALLPTPTM